MAEPADGSAYSTADQLRFLAFVLSSVVLVFSDVLYGAGALALALGLISAWERTR